MELIKQFSIINYDQPLKEDHKYYHDDKYNYVADLFDQNQPGKLQDFDIGNIDELRNKGVHPGDLEGKILVARFVPREIDRSRNLMEQLERDDFVMHEIAKHEVITLGQDNNSSTGICYTAEFMAYKRIMGYNSLSVNLTEPEYKELKANPHLVMRAEFSFKDLM